MEAPIKKRNAFFPRFFKAFTLYIFVAFSVFFGYVQVVGGIEPAKISLPTGAVSAEEDSAFNSFVSQVMSAKNLSVNDFVLSLESADKTLVASVCGNIFIDRESESVSVDLDVVYNQTNFDFGVVYTNPYLYLSIEDKTYKFNVQPEQKIRANSASGFDFGNFDFGKILDIVAQYVDLSPLESMLSDFGIDIKNPDLNALTQKLKITSKANEDGTYKFTIDLASAISLIINCDENFNITSVKLNDVYVKGNSIKFSAPNVVMNSSDGENVAVPEDGVIDLTGISSYANYVQNLFDKDYVDITVNVCVDEKSYDANVLLDMSDGLKVKAQTMVEGIHASVVYVDETIYVDVENLKLSFDISDVEIWKDKAVALIEKYTSKTVSEIVEELVSKVEGYAGIDFSEEDGQKQIINTILGGISGTETIAGFLPDKAEESDNSIVLLWNNGLNVRIENENQLLSAVKVSYGDISVSAEFEVVEEGIVVDGQYFDLSSMLPLVDFAEKVFDAKKICGNIKVLFGELELSAEYVVDLQSLTAKIVVANELKDAEIYLTKQNVIIKIDEVAIECPFSQIEENIEKIAQIFGLDIPEIVIDGAVETTNFVELIADILNTIKLSSVGDISRIEYLDNIVDFVVENDVLSLVYSGNDVKVKADIKESAQEISLPVVSDELSSVLNKIENTKNYIESGKYAFEMNAKYNNIDLSVKISVDIENMTFAISDLMIGQNDLNVYYSNGVAYVNYGGNKLKLHINKIEDLLAVVAPIVKANGIDLNSLNMEEMMVEIFGEDISKLSVEEILQKLSVELKGSLNNLNVGLLFGFEKEISTNITIKFDEDNLKAITVSLFDALVNIEVATYEETEIVEAEYYDILSAQSGNVTLVYGDIEIYFDVKVDLNGKVYVNAKTTLFGEDIEIEVLNNMFYAKVGEVVLGTNFNNVKELVGYIAETFNLVMPEIGANIDIESIDVNETNILSCVEGLDISVAGNGLNLTFANGKLSLKVELGVAEGFEIEVPNQYEDLTDVIEKAENLKSYIEKGIFEFDFVASYNDFDFVGVFKFGGNVVEIETFAAGEKVYIRIENEILYFAYGNMKLKFDISSSENSEVDLVDTLDNILGDSLPVKLQFGAFEELLTILKDYDINDYFDKIILNLSGNTNDLFMSISDKKVLSVSKILTSNIKFEENKLSSVDFDLYGILIANLSVNYVEESTISQFDSEKFKDYSDDFVAGVLDSLKVDEDVYAFSSDISVRYSNNQFLGEIVAMVKYDETVDSILGHFVPAVQIYTTSLGVESYIYIVDESIYIDIQGLQLSADLNQNSIDEILQFVENNFGVSLTTQETEVAVDVFKVIIPAIDKIYAQWVEMVSDCITYNGVQVRIDDALWYDASSRFENIILQAFIENRDNTIVPTKVVLGANIYDPNTTVYDNYDEYLLDIEEPVTSNLNFAVYLTNLEVGKFAEDALEAFVFDENWNVVAIKSNYGTTKLSDFIDYNAALSMVEALMNFASDMNYQVAVSGEVVGLGSQTTTLGANINVELGDLQEGELNESGFELFDGKYLKVQGAIDLIASGIEHAMNIFYESKNTSALYATYTHGNFIGSGDSIKQKIGNASKALKAKVANANLSEIIAMVLKFAGVDLGEEMENKLGLQECSTDFRYLRTLIGLKEAEVDTSGISQVDKILSSVESFAKIVKNIKLSQTDIGNGLNQTKLAITVDLAEDGNLATIELVFKEELNNDIVENKFRQIVVSNLAFSGNIINATIDIEDFAVENFDYDTSAEHIDMSDISSFIDVAVTTLNTKSFAFKGETTVALGSYTINVGFDIFASFDENNELYLYMELSPEYKDDVTGSAQINPDYTSYILAGGSYDRRTSVVEYKNGYLTIVQYTYGIKATALTSDNKKYDQVRGYRHGDNWIYTKDQIGENIMVIMAQALGLSRTVYNIIKLAVNMVNANPTVEEALLAFSKTSSGYALKVNAENLTGMSGVKDLTLNIGVSQPYNVRIDGVDAGEHRFIDNITTTIEIGDVITIPLTLNSVGGTSYQTAGNKVIYTNDYYRQIYAYQIKTLKFETNCSQYVSAIISPAAEVIVLPTLKDFDIDDGLTLKHYFFENWYTTSECVDGTEFMENIMPNDDTTLYAKWNVVTECYRTISFETNSKYSTESITQLEGTAYTLPTLETYVVDDGVTKTTRTFAGWWTTSNFQEGTKVENGIVPLHDQTFYAKWNDSNEYYRTISFKTNSDTTFENITKLEGEEVSIPTLTTKEEIDGNTTTFYKFDGWYVDKNYQTAFTASIMPTQNLTLYAKWTVTKVEKISNLNVYNNGEFATTLRVKSGDTIDLSQFDFVNQESEFFYDSAYTLPMLDFVMPENDLNVYVANKYTVTVISEYGKAGTFTYNDYQGRAISLPTQETYVVDDGQIKTTYTFLGYSEEVSTIPSADKTITANWSVDVKHYYTVSFDTTFVHPSTWNDNNNSFTGKITCKQPAGTIAPVKVLEGTVLDVTQYTTTAKYNYQAVFATASYTFEVKSWNTTGCISITDGVSNYSYDKMETLTVTGDTTLYAIWGKA